MERLAAFVVDEVEWPRHHRVLLGGHVRAAVLGARGNLGRLVVAEAERRGTAYRIRIDERLVTTDETSRRYFDVSQISYGDCALATVDELERPRLSRAFVSLGW